MANVMPECLLFVLGRVSPAESCQHTAEGVRFRAGVCGFSGVVEQYFTAGNGEERYCEASRAGGMAFAPEKSDDLNRCSLTFAREIDHGSDNERRLAGADPLGR